MRSTRWQPTSERVGGVPSALKEICILWKTWKEKKSCNIFKCDDRNMHCLFVTCAVCDGVREVDYIEYPDARVQRHAIRGRAPSCACVSFICDCVSRRVHVPYSTTCDLCGDWRCRASVRLCVCAPPRAPGSAAWSAGAKEK